MAAKTPPSSPRPTLPVLPRPAAVGTGDLAATRRFHFAPEPAGDAVHGLVPALLAPYRGAPVRGDYPLYLPPPEPGAQPLSLPELLDRLLPAAGAERLLADNLRRLEGRVREGVAAPSGTGEPVDAGAALEAAAAGLGEELALPGADAGRLDAALGALVAALPPGGRLLPWSGAVPLHLLAWAAEGRAAAAREAFRAEAADLARSLATLLGRERGGDAGAGRLASALGSLGDRFVDRDRLAGDLAAGRRGAELAPPRRLRLEGALAILEAAAAGGGAVPTVVMSQDGPVPAGWQAAVAEEPFAAAAEHFDATAAELARALGAIRLARLELAGAFDAERHGPALARFDWRSFEAAERDLVGPVVAVAPARHAAGAGLAGLSRLLLSGRPVQILLVGPPADPGSEGSGFRFEAASLGMGHRVAFVQQSSRARPHHLAAGLGAGLAAGRTALHVIDAGGTPVAGLDPWLVAGAEVEGRALPLLRFDPEAGDGWARRLELASNPAPEADWPTAELALRREGGGEESLSLAFTFADHALLDPAWAGHFRSLPSGLEHEELVGVGEWLALAAGDALHRIPTIWAVDDGGRLVRLAVSRALVLAARDRLDFWRTLQEMAGVRSEVALRAAEDARREAAEAAAAEIESLRSAHATELDRVRRHALEQAVDQLTGALLGLDPAAFAPAGGLPLGGSAEELAEALLAAVGDGTAPAEPAGEEVDRVAAELLAMVDVAALDGESAP